MEPTQFTDSAFVYGCDVPRFRLSDGQEVYLVAMHAKATYDGLLMGKPNRSINDLILTSAIREARHLFHMGEPETGGKDPWLVHPERKGQGSAPPNRRDPEDLPGVLWMARLKSGPIPSMPGLEFSDLVVIWFQEDFQLSSRSEEILQNLDWDAHAWSYGVEDL